MEHFLISPAKNFPQGYTDKFDQPWSFFGVMRVASTNLGLIGLAVLTFIENKQTRQTSILYRKLAWEPSVDQGSHSLSRRLPALCCKLRF